MAAKLKQAVEVEEIGTFLGAFASAEVLKSLGILEPGTLVCVSFNNHDVGRVPIKLDRNMKGMKMRLNVITAGFLGAQVGDTVTLTA